MKIIQTRYRDLPLEEINAPLRYPQEWEGKRRGQSIQLVANAEFREQGPRFAHSCVYYFVVGRKTLDGLDEMVCAHFAEIGD